MPTDDPLRRFRDIVVHAARIAEFTQGMDKQTFAADIKTVLAVERCLQIISEAAVKLGETAETHAPEIPWADVRGMGNELRHGYDTLDEDVVWITIQDHIAPLRTAAERAIRALCVKETRGRL